MRKLFTALLMVGLILLVSTPVLAGYQPIIHESSAPWAFGGGLLVLGMIGNRRFLKR